MKNLILDYDRDSLTFSVSMYDDSANTISDIGQVKIVNSESDPAKDMLVLILKARPDRIAVASDILTSSQFVNFSLKKLFSECGMSIDERGNINYTSEASSDKDSDMEECRLIKHMTKQELDELAEKISKASPTVVTLTSEESEGRQS